ncbi:MAG: hypothetical protein ACJAS3_001689 [Roseivirga sp.]|jgi:hypothetical protein
MELDFKTLLYIAFGIIYFIYSAKKKSDKRKADASEPDRGEDILGPPTMRQPTFEDLLQEFTGRKPKAVQPAPRPVEAQPFSEPNPLFTEVPKIQRSTILENAAKKKQAYALELAEAEKNAVVEVEEESYADTLSTLEGAKRAFVFTEIFNKKY